MTERIGSDVLNAAERAQQQMQEKKKKELLQRLQEEKARKSGRPEMVPSEGVPGEHAHERKPGEGADLDVHVRQHRRGVFPIGSSPMLRNALSPCLL